MPRPTHTYKPNPPKENYMSIKIKPLFIHYKSIPKAIEAGYDFSSIPLDKRRGGQWAQVKQAQGTIRWDLSAVSTHHKATWADIESRLMKHTMRFLPTYTPRKSTMACAGDKLSAIRHDLKMAILYLMQSYAKKEWSYVASYSSAVNTHFLTYHIAVNALAGGALVEYRNKEDIHCDYHRIPRGEKTIFSRRKKPVKK